MNVTNFTPTDNTVSISASTSSARVALEGSREPLQVLILNTHTAVIYIAFGDSSVEATANDTPIPSNGWITLNAEKNTHVAALAASGNGTIYFTPGEGT